MTNIAKASNAQVRKAAGCPSLERLKAVIDAGEWAADQLDDMATDDGKNPLHMAAWQGALENLEYLLQIGCNVNAIATGTYSYGKTPIFFACTRSRDDHVRLLLKQGGAHVRIVNNKGQSVLSIASSHLLPETVALIQEAERDQAHIPWKNYRATHSDGLVYGDLDPRFLDRPLTPLDHVTDLAINPTTKQSRRGSFLRRNPHTQPKTESSRKPRKKKVPVGLSPEQVQQLQDAWRRLERGFIMGQPDPTDALVILQLSDQKRESWIPPTVARLERIAGNQKVVAAFLESVQSSSTRDLQLLQKLTVSAFNGEKIVRKGKGIDPPPRASKSIPRKHASVQSIREGRWLEICQAVRGLSMTVFEQHISDRMSLPKEPLWIDSIETLREFEESVKSFQVVAVDTEWTTMTPAPDNTKENVVAIATIQFAAWSKASGIIVWILDLLIPDCPYQQFCRQLLRKIFEEKLLVGFAFGHDLSKLQAWQNSCHSESQNQLCQANILDVQRLWRQKQPIGLAKCAGEFSTKILSKKEQRSDWAMRPLSSAQLDYAGLDAAVLLAIVAEKYVLEICKRGEEKTTYEVTKQTNPS